MYSKTFDFGPYKTRVHIGESCEDFAGFIEKNTGLLFICDTNTEEYARGLFPAGGAPICVLPAGEEHKTWAQAERVLLAAKEAGLSRDGLFIAVGGGVVTDLAGFAASIYMRGARLAFVSTTLLGMVDASLGGKTGFDIGSVKNLAGAFYPASDVFMPLASLKTLPEREFMSGLAEALKTAVISGEPYALELCENAAEGGRANAARDDLEALVRMCVETKARVVSADPREESGIRAVLNLGHTFGHALESAAGLGVLTHGEAVAWGMGRACALGEKLGRTPHSLFIRITSLLASFGFAAGPKPPPAVDTTNFADRIMEAMRSDKKKQAGRLKFVVPTPLGVEVIAPENGEALARSVL